jgi:quercetin dioxygenase-like cupin family protein
MINFIPPATGPRDPDALSPHSHEDFEQLSLVTTGDFIHHIRTPWTTRSTDWVDDVHWRTSAPSVAIIPPPTVHTSQATSEGMNTIVDIFSPPRRDFSERPGWVLNSDDYPAP